MIISLNQNSLPNDCNEILYWVLHYWVQVPSYLKYMRDYVIGAGMQYSFPFDNANHQTYGFDNNMALVFYYTE